MEVFYKLIKNINKLNINKLLNELLRTNDVQNFIIDLNTRKQLFNKGIDSNDETLGEYAPYTIQLKIEDNLPINRITLYQTGDFYRSFKIKVKKDYFEIDANPEKGDNNLFDDFGIDILGLNEDSKEKLINYLLPLLLENIKTKILDL